MLRYRICEKPVAMNLEELADMRNVINFEADDYFKILMRFDNNVMVEVEYAGFHQLDLMGAITMG